MSVPALTIVLGEGHTRNNITSLEDHYQGRKMQFVEAREFSLRVRKFLTMLNLCSA